MYKRAQILLQFEKEEIHNFQPLLQVQEELMQLPVDFLEQKCGKVIVIRGILHPDLLSDLSVNLKITLKIQRVRITQGFNLVLKLK